MSENNSVDEAREVRKLRDGVRHIENLINIQKGDGNWNYDPYMLGLANGLILAQACLLDQNPEYIQEPEQYLRNVEVTDVATTHRAVDDFKVASHARMTEKVSDVVSAIPELAQELRKEESEGKASPQVENPHMHNKTSSEAYLDRMQKDLEDKKREIDILAQNIEGMTKILQGHKDGS